MHKTSAEISGMGHSMKRKEDGRFIQGKGNYVDDVNLLSASSDAPYR